MPIPVSPINRQITSAIPLTSQRRDECATLFVERTTAPEVMVVIRDFEQAFARNITAARDILQKRHHIFMLFRAAERD